MASSFEKAVKGGTKVKLAPPKAKYVQAILSATDSDAGVAEVFRTLTHRLRDSTWTVAFKALIIVHLMIKEGAPDTTLRYLAVAPHNRLAINSFTDVQTQGQNIRVYSDYLLARARAFEKFHCDHIRDGEGRMKRLTIDKGLLRQTETVQDQIRALTKCDLLTNDAENEISLTAFRLLTRDLLDLYNVENEAVMNVLSHYFEMSKPDAERAIRIYKRFCSQTDHVVQYLSMARRYEYATRLEIPKLKHAPTSLAKSLQDYLDDPDFEVNRRQYIAEQEAKKSGKPVFKSSQAKAAPASASAATPFDFPSASQPAASAPKAAGPAPDLMDFFESIESNQQTMATNPFLQRQQAQSQPQPQYTGFQAPPVQQQQAQSQPQPQFTGFQAPLQNPGFQQPVQQQQAFGFGSNGAPTDAFSQLQIDQQQAPQPIQTQFTGAGFGGYTPEPQSFASPVQQQTPSQLQAQPTNPFRHQAMPTGNQQSFATPAFDQSQPQQPTRQGTNPFARSQLPPSIPESGAYQTQPSTFARPPPFQALLQAQPTGTNPFARNATGTPQQPAAPALQVQSTGSTNPFRQSMFMNQQTGQGWQQNQQPTIGGIEQLPTIPVFPRPGQANPQQQQAPWM